MGDIIEFPSRDTQMEFIDSLNEWQLEIFLEIVRTTQLEFDNLCELYELKKAECKKLKMKIKKLKEEKK